MKCNIRATILWSLQNTMRRDPNGFASNMELVGGGGGVRRFACRFYPGIDPTRESAFH